MRQFAGFGTAEETNERFRYLLDHGQTGLEHRVRHAVVDGPRLRPRAVAGRGRARGRGGRHARRHGDAVCGDRSRRGQRVDDDQRAGGDHDGLLRRRGEEKGIPADRLCGTIQADILKEYIAQKEWCFPVDPAMRLLGDMMQWCTGHMPRWHPVSISGYHIREAGSTAAQELAFTLKDGLTYVEEQVARGMDVDDFAPRLSLLLQRAHRLLRGDRQVPRGAADLGARAARDVRRQEPEKSWLMRFHTQTAGVVADGAAAAQQRRPHRDRGARRGARRHAVAAHQLARRGARAPERGGGARGAAHAADHRARDRRDEHDRPARRLVLRRVADRSHGAARVRVLRQDRRARRDGRGGQARLSRSARSPTRRSSSSGSTTRRAHARRRELLQGGRRRRDRDPADRPRARAQADRPRPGRPRPPRRRRRRGRAGARLTRRGRADGATSCRPPRRARVHASEGEIVESLQDVWGSYTETPVF